MKSKVRGQTRKQAEKMSVYTTSNDIKINPSDLKLQFIEFKSAVERSIDIPSTAITLTALWTPIFTVVQFKNILGVDGQSIYMAYLVFAVIMSIVIIYRGRLSFVKPVFKTPFFRKKFISWQEKNETDPELRTQIILKRCRIKYYKH